MVGYKHILHRKQGSRRGEENAWAAMLWGSSADDELMSKHGSLMCQLRRKKLNS